MTHLGIIVGIIVAQAILTIVVLDIRKRAQADDSDGAK